jgi:hypothetical protein
MTKKERLAMVVKEGIPSRLETGPDKSGNYKNLEVKGFQNAQI